MFNLVFNKDALFILMVPFVALLSTTPSVGVAKKIAHALVSSKLVACVNVVPSVTSVYSWEGRIHEDEEQLLVIKTRRENLEEIKKIVESCHPYQVPELIAVPIVDGSEKYLDWMDKTVVVNPGPGASN